MFCFGGIFAMVLLVALGFVILHFAEKENSFNLKIAGYLLAAAGAIMALSAATMMFFGGCNYDRMGHHGEMHGNHGMMRTGCDHMKGKNIDGTNVLPKDAAGAK